MFLTAGLPSFIGCLGQKERMSHWLEDVFQSWFWIKLTPPFLPKDPAGMKTHKAGRRNHSSDTIKKHAWTLQLCHIRVLFSVCYRTQTSPSTQRVRGSLAPEWQSMFLTDSQSIKWPQTNITLHKRDAKCWFETTKRWEKDAEWRHLNHIKQNRLNRHRK